MSFLDQLLEKNPQKTAPVAVFDDMGYATENDVAAAELTTLRLDVAGVLAEWAETDEDDLDDGETLLDRFDALMIGCVDTNKNGELDDDELEVLDYAYNIASDLMASYGVSDDDISAMLNDSDDDATANIHELLINTGADGEDAELARIHAAAFDFDEDSDAAVMDATYRRVLAIRNGKKTRIRKRIAGVVKLTAKQKMAIRKAQMKAHSGKARAQRLKSLRIRRKTIG
ncbi:hypothetical protein QDY71_02305 [Kingella negevensis]|uniref:EF-hand domain-containing protein n=1 Tax=Kingella negevensis TaxID=1522312 RepID=A0A238HF82_9NEIS|nr:hypothetical protein [Kingella negevensis]MDK4684707.1 hypothetical protein [Kingella negevensis]MDK4696615.1 hypothetical protein [Kingella negevensis]MDK4707361.1 hypothetical protein [Kingella negevensis]MDK4710161.1 hypothetical protein [Kingella negevensis]SNB53764.1 Uncharacterised protein [Kingella negevensis]